jgi:hypothetical protein
LAHDLVHHEKEGETERNGFSTFVTSICFRSYIRSLDLIFLEHFPPGSPRARARRPRLSTSRLSKSIIPLPHLVCLSVCR